MTDEQQGWNDALEIVVETFRDFTWQKDLAQERKLAAASDTRTINNFRTKCLRELKKIKCA